jgi:hypothetical protein
LEWEEKAWCVQYCTHHISISFHFSHIHLENIYPYHIMNYFRALDANIAQINPYTHDNALRPAYREMMRFMDGTVIPAYADMKELALNAYVGWKENASQVNLPFCESPYALSPYVPQLASAAAHFPYIPLMLLGVLWGAPSVFRASADTTRMARTMLGIQLVLQSATCVGHIIPNPRALLVQEASILATMTYLIYVHHAFTTGTKYRFRTSLIISSVMVGGFLVIGLMPLIATSAVCVGITVLLIPNAFDKLTQRSARLLMGLMCFAIAELLVEESQCGRLMAVSETFPCHVVFDILFWQVIATIPSIILLSDPADGWVR